MEFGGDGGDAPETNRFSAAPAALGYLSQVEYALLLALQRLDTDLVFEVSIETLDDVVFENGSGHSLPE